MLTPSWPLLSLHQSCLVWAAACLDISLCSVLCLFSFFLVFSPFFSASNTDCRPETQILFWWDRARRLRTDLRQRVRAGAGRLWGRSRELRQNRRPHPLCFKQQTATAGAQGLPAWGFPPSFITNDLFEWNTALAPLLLAFKQEEITDDDIRAGDGGTGHSKEEKHLTCLFGKMVFLC